MYEKQPSCYFVPSCLCGKRNVKCKILNVKCKSWILEMKSLQSHVLKTSPPTPLLKAEGSQINYLLKLKTAFVLLCALASSWQKTPRNLTHFILRGKKIRAFVAIKM